MVNETRMQPGERLRMRKVWCAKARGEGWHAEGVTCSNVQAIADAYLTLHVQLYQDALCTPGSSPASAFSRNWYYEGWDQHTKEPARAG